jgi:S1-C subfamily serine protease
VYSLDNGGVMRGRLAASVAILLLTTITCVAADLPSRYKALSCAVVHIKNDSVSGTGFFIDDKGTIVTAGHVLLEAAASASVPNSTDFRPYSNVVVTDLDDNHFPASLGKMTDDDISNLQHDLVILKTNIANKCHLVLGDSKTVLAGQSVIAMGFPQQAVHAIIYTGIISGRLALLQPNVPFDFLRVQMPISPGASGGPLLDDNDKVVGVVDAEPFGFPPDVNRVAQTYGAGKSVSSGTFIAGVDLAKVVGEMAYAITAGVSPGSGYGMPIEYLRQ